MRVAAIIPVGPGHEDVAFDAQRSVSEAWATSEGPFTDLQVQRVLDPWGREGRSRARNTGMDAFPEADWFLLLDADDLLMPTAFESAAVALDVTPHAVGIWGAIYTERLKVTAKNRHPLTFDDLLGETTCGTLSMGCFVRAPEARATRFNEELSNGEDFDFYLRLLDGRPFVKLEVPLVLIRDTVPNCDGTGPKQGKWVQACDAQVQRFLAHRVTT